MKPQMNTITHPPSAPRRRKSRTSAKNGLGAAFGWLMLILLSPFLLILDGLRLGPSHRQTLYAFMLFATVVVILTGMTIFVTDGPTKRLCDILNAVENYENLGEVPHDLELNAVNQSAVKYHIDPHLIMALIKAESNFNTEAISYKGARGLMQVRPPVWRHYQPRSRCHGEHPPTLRCPDGDCIFDPVRNIDTGTHYLSDLIRRFNGRTDLAVEAYNAGLTHVTPGAPPKFAETRSYIQRVAAAWAEFRRTPTLTQIHLVISLRKALRWMLILCLSLWLALMFWITRRVLGKV